MPPSDQELLNEGGANLGVELDEEALRRCSAYLDLLEKWNKTYNLTAVRSRHEMVTRHLLDSLAVSSHLVGQRIIDVGSGGGLPGVPLAIANPRRQFFLLDSNGKKSRFLFQVKTSLQLDNMHVIRDRVQSHEPDVHYDCVVSRAFATLSEMYASCRHLLGENGVMLAMKGVSPDAELADMDPEAVAGVMQLQVPGLEEQRTLIFLRVQTEVMGGQYQWRELSR